MSLAAGLRFKRGSALELQIQRSAGNRFYVGLMQRVGRPLHAARWQMIAYMWCVKPDDMHLMKIEGEEHWGLEADGAWFRLSETEAHKVSEAFPEIAERVISMLAAGAQAAETSAELR